LKAFLISPCVLHVPLIHHPWCHQPNNMWWRIQIMEPIIMQFSPASCHLICLWSKYSTQHPVHKHSRSVFFP
jgi:hypothetical protein